MEDPGRPAPPARQPCGNIDQWCGHLGDRIRILKLVGEACRNGRSGSGPGHRGQHGGILRTRGFSGNFIRDFLGPFFSGIFLDDRLSPPPAQFLYTLRMFASGAVVRPAAGIDALVHQLSGGLERTEIRLGTRVAAVSGTGWSWSRGRWLEGRGVMYARSKGDRM